MLAGILHDRDKRQRPNAYDKDTFISSHSSKLAEPSAPLNTTPVLSSIFLTSAYTIGKKDNCQQLKMPVISTSPILFLSAAGNTNTDFKWPTKEPEMRITTSTRQLISEWIFIDDVLGSLYLWSQTIPPARAIWQFTFLFTDERNQELF